MIQAYLILNTRRLLTVYLSNLQNGSMTLNGADIAFRPVVRRWLPDGVTAHMVTIEDPAGGWSAAIEVLKQGSAVWRSTIEGCFGDQEGIDSEDARRLYLNWLFTT